MTSSANEHAAAALTQPCGSSEPVLIAGGGIGGLAAAIALAQRDIPSLVLERRAAFQEEGAGIQLGPNGTRILQHLGIAEVLRPHVGVPDGIRVRDGGSGAELAYLPLGTWIKARHGAPYWVAHRQDLHAALLEVASAEPRITLTTDFAVSEVATDDSRAAVATETGRTHTGRALVGADGLWSAVRERVFHTAAPRFAGKCAARSVVPLAHLPPQLRAQEVGIWLFADAHVVHYPVSGGANLAIVAIVDDPHAEPGWSAPIPPTWVEERLPPRANLLRDLIAAPSTWRKWALHLLAPTFGWTEGRVALLGDAAHPVVPFLAQGGVLALEDAFVLAATLHASGDDVIAALKRYEQMRRPRALRVAEASRQNGRIYHLSGPLRAARDLALRTIPSSLMMARYDWLYGWRAD